MPQGTTPGHRRSPGPFHSKAQWRWAFARHEPFAEKWAHENQAVRPYKTLPGGGLHGTATTKAAKIRTVLTRGAAS